MSEIEAIARARSRPGFAMPARCVSPQRFFVHRRLSAFEEVVIGDAQAPVRLRPRGDRASAPRISARHRERVEGLIAAATSGGARVRTGGTRPSRPGFFLEPTVLGDVNPAMPPFADEVFGPLFAVSAFDRLDDAIVAANSTRYGLAAYVFTNDLAAAIHAYERLDFGIVGVNEWAPHATEAPFSGRKDSGVGHEAGREGLLDNLETKLVSFGNVR
jgi:acyl-CoA reductase-like NAD-dependent aldehyde dehydrogenase